MAKKGSDSTGLRIEYLPLSSVKRFDRNPKKHDVGALVTSIQRYGFRDAPIFDGTLGALVAGHGRLKALDELRKQKGDPPRGIQTGDKGEWLVPVQLGVDAASAAEAQAFLVDHNALTVAGGDMGVEGILRLYDQDGLGAMLKEMAEAGEMPVTLDGDDLDALLGNEKPALDAEPQIDRAAELQKKWGTERGQLWALGDHRLLCGDSTSHEDVVWVMSGELAALVYTDPPYGVGYDGGTKVREKLAGDENADLYGPACFMAAKYSTDKAALYLWHAGIKGIAAAAAAAAAAAGYEIRCEIVWNKNLAQYGALSAHYKQKHEPLYYCFKRGRVVAWYGPTNEITVWDCDRAMANEFHPTQKPVELAVRAMKNSSATGDSVLDLFLGSGATLIAAEQLGRRCYGIEISPEYVAVTLQRFADATGKTPELLP